jgi:hypothetical protein
MQSRRVLVLSMAVSCLLLAGSLACSAQSDSLQINELKDDYVISVPVSRLVLTIPKGGFSEVKNSRGGAAASSRYFELEDKTLGLIVSGWFEPESGYPGVKKFWEGEVQAWRQRGLPEPKDVSFEKLGKWDVVTYAIPIPGACNSHIRAEWADAGTWIDLHLSATARGPSAGCKASVTELLQELQVRRKE